MAGKALSTGKKKMHRGFVVPGNHRKQALLYNDSTDLVKIERLRYAVESGATWRAAAMQAGMFPSEFEYMWHLGRHGHPAYSGLVCDLMKARGDFATKLQSHMVEHALTEEGLADGTTARVLKAEEKDSWIDDREKVAEVTVNMGIGKVVLRTDFGDAEEEDVVEGEIVDAEAVSG